MGLSPLKIEDEIKDRDVENIDENSDQSKVETQATSNSPLKDSKASSGVGSLLRLQDTKEQVMMPDSKRVIYDLQELHDMPVRVRPFFSQRQFVHFGYRAHVNMTFCRCTSTILNLHCETGSIWSHLASAVYWAF